MAVFSRGKRRARNAKHRHHPETKANWIIVRVIGLGKALRMVFEEVLVRAELKYQIRQSTWYGCQLVHVSIPKSPTEILRDTGALSASAISCAFSLTLAFLSRICLKALPILLCRPFSLVPTTLRWPSPHARWLSFRACHPSLCSTPFDFPGLDVLIDPLLRFSHSSYLGKFSPDKEASRVGNFPFGFDEEDRRRSRSRELIVRCEKMRGCDLDMDYADDSHSSICISFEAETNRVISRAGKHMVMA